MVFTTNPKTIDFTLNYESSASNPDDEAVFSDLDNIIEANVHDHTDAGSLYQRSQRLTGTADAAIGSVLTIPVGAGDRISASVYTKYLAPTATDNPGVAIGALLAAAISGGTTYEGAINSSYGTSGSIITNLFNDQVSATEPMAFINLLFLPGEGASSIDPGQFTFKQIGSASSNAHALLTLDEPFEAPGAGHVVVYLSNESEVLTEVYFDDLVIMVNEHPVVQSNDYYPGGLTFNSYQRVTAKENRFLYNQGTGDKVFNTERIIDLELNLDMTKFRMYDYQLMRFLQIDPKADAAGQESWTPYHYAFNNPIRYNDPYGDCPPGVICTDPLPNMQVRRNRASNLGPGMVRNNGTRAHRGHDLYSPAGTRVSSTLAGKVVSSYNSTSYGNTVVVKSNIHPEAQPGFTGPIRQTITGPNGETNVPQDNIYVQYSHLTDRDVAVGDDVTVGQQVGTVGTTGNASPGADGLDTHLHIQVGPSLNAAGTSVNNATAVNPNLVYDNVSFSSQNPNANQTKTGVIKTVIDANGQQQRIYQPVNTTGQDALLLNEVVITGN